MPKSNYDDRKSFNVYIILTDEQRENLSKIQTRFGTDNSAVAKAAIDLFIKDRLEMIRILDENKTQLAN